MAIESCYFKKIPYFWNKKKHDKSNSSTRQYKEYMLHFLANFALWFTKYFFFTLQFHIFKLSISKSLFFLVGALSQYSRTVRPNSFRIGKPRPLLVVSDSRPLTLLYRRILERSPAPKFATPRFPQNWQKCAWLFTQSTSPFLPLFVLRSLKTPEIAWNFEFDFCRLRINRCAVFVASIFHSYFFTLLVRFIVAVDDFHTSRRISLCSTKPRKSRFWEYFETNVCLQFYFFTAYMPLSRLANAQ